MTIRSYQYQVQALVTLDSVVNVERTAAQALGVADELSFEIETPSISRSGTDALSVSDDAFFIQLPGGVTSLDQSLGLTDNVEAEGFRLAVSSLDLSDLVDFRFAIFSREPADSLDVTDSVSFGFLIDAIDVTDALSLTQSVGKSFTVTVAQDLGVTDLAIYTATVNDLNLTQSVVWGYGYDASNSLQLIQAVNVIQGLTKGQSDSLAVTDSVAYYSESRCDRYSFKTNHGQGGVAPKERALNYRSRLYFQSIDTGEILQLKNPEMDDRRRVAYNRVNRRFFDGTADVYADAGWVTEETQVYTITALKADKLELLITFLSDNLGREIYLKDWVGVTWKVIVTNPGEVYTEDSEGYWTVDFTVEGSAMVGEYIITPESLTQSNSRSGSEWLRPVAESLSVSSELSYTIVPA